MLVALPLGAAWQETKSGPFVVVSDASEKDARAALYLLEQFRFTFGEALGRTDLKTAWPITVIVAKPGALVRAHTLGFSRDGWIITWPAGSTPPPALFKRLALLLIEDNWPGRMPGTLEETFASLYSTLKLRGPRLVLGEPPAQAERTREWALLQYLMTHEETASRTRVFLSNLANGGDMGAAFRNSYDIPRAQIEAAVDRYFAAGHFLTIEISPRPMDPEHAFHFIPALAARVRVVAGDIALARNAAGEARLAYQNAINERPGAWGFEGLGLALLAEGHKEDARLAFESMKKMMDPATHVCARGLAELGLFEEAAKANPRWAEPYVRAAAAQPGPVRKAYFLKKAAELEPRNPEIWSRLAEVQATAGQTDEAGRSWYAAERVARSAKEREAILHSREAFQQARSDAEAAERKRLRLEDELATQKARQEMLDNIHRAEQKANTGRVPEGKAVPWWDGPPTTSFTGTLESVTCQGRRARLVLRDAAGRAVTLAVGDPSKVVLLGTDQQQAQLTCGAQRPPRRVKIEYVAKPGATGEVVSIEYLK